MLPRIGDYEVRFEIGRGGFGRVYLAYDPRVGRLVAIKVIDKAADLQMVGRFRAEANAAGNLRHKNIVTIYGYGEDDGQAFLVMEYLEGRDLHQIIEKKLPLTLLEKVAIMAQIADGLSCAHRNGVIHRDVKPANVMVLKDGLVKIMDFGIARLLREGSARLTQGSDLVGTISYMAPEQFTNSDVDALCDIWGFGVMFYELLTGEHPFVAKNSGAIMYRITNVDPPPVRTLASECGAALDRLVMKLLAKDRENRYQTVEDVQFEIAPVLRELQQARASALLANAEALMREGRLEDANAKIAAIMELDPANEEARRLRADFQEQKRQRTIRPKVVALLRQAEIDAANRNFASAMRAADSASRLDPEDTGIQNYRAGLQRAHEAAEASIQLTQQAREQMEAEDLALALETVSNAVRKDAGNASAQRLLERIRNEMEAQQERARFKDQLNRAEVFLGMGALYEAGTLVNELRIEHPESDEVAELAERLSDHKKAAARRERLLNEMNACRDLMRMDDPAEAVRRLEALGEEFPEELQPRELLARAREQFETRERDRFCEALEAEVRAEIAAKRFQTAHESLQTGLAAYPQDARWRPLTVAIERGKAEYEKALRLEEGLRKCAELRGRGDLDDAARALDGLRSEHGDEPRVMALAAEVARLRAERTRTLAIETAVEGARALVSADQPAAAIGLLRQAIAEHGEDARFLPPLGEAAAAQQKQDKQRDLAWRMERIAEYEKAKRCDTALVAIDQALDVHGDVGELCSARERIEARQRVQALVEAADSSIRRKDWQAARAALLRAQSEHPQEAVWQELADRVRAGEMREGIEWSLARQELERARESIVEARAQKLPIEGLEAFEAELEGAERRRGKLREAQALIDGGNDAAAEAILSTLPNETEVLEAQRSIRERREEQQRAARRQTAFDEALRLLNGQQYEAAIRALKGLLSEFGPDARVEEKLSIAVAARDRIVAEQNYARGREQAGALAASGQFEAALRTYRDLMARRPEDEELRKEAASAEGAWQAATRQQGLLRERDRALELIGEKKYNEALRVLQPLMHELRDDPAAQDGWRTALAERASRSDWLDTYQEVAAIEDLYRKGKAEKVRERAQALLASTEEPRVRELLRWADAELATGKRTGVSFTRPRSGDWAAILAGPASVGVLAVWILLRFL